MNKALMLVLLIIAVAVAFFAGTQWQAQSTAEDSTADTGERKILYWKAPMDPNYRRDEPGKSPMGMDLVPVYADEASDEAGIVQVSPAVVNSLGVRTARALSGPLARNIDTVGYVAYDEHTMQQVSTRVEGWVEKLGVKAAGDVVEPGQVLFELYSPALVNAQEEYLATLRSSNVALKRASRERLVSLGIGTSELARLDKQRTVRQRQRIYATRGGVVTHLGVREGAFVRPATPVMTIAGVDSMWIHVEVFERQAAWVEAGQAAQVELDYLPGQTRTGVVDYLYPELDSKTRTLTARIRLDNAERVLRPNMFARVRLVGAPTGPVIHVPREAVIRGGAVDRVVLALGGGRFRSQSVITGIESGGRVEIRTGLAAGDRIVSSGQFLIDSESNIDNALARLDAAPVSVRVGAVVEGYRVAQRYITVRHDPVEAWSWPSMSMGFVVENAALLENLQVGQQVGLIVERRGEGDYVVTSIATEGQP